MLSDTTLKVIYVESGPNLFLRCKAGPSFLSNRDTASNCLHDKIRDDCNHDHKHDCQPYYFVIRGKQIRTHDPCHEDGRQTYHHE